MVDLRLYRLAFVPFVLVVFFVAFSLAPRPRPFTSTLAPDAFDGSSAMVTLRALAAQYPARQPGSPGDERLAQAMAGAFHDAGFATSTERYTGDTVTGRTPLTTVIGRRQGKAGGAIVIVAHRDSRRPGSPAELSGTAALLELARVFGNRVTQRTLTLVSTSGGSGGAAGTADLVRHLTDPVDAVIVLGDLAGSRSRRPYVVPWSDGSQIAPIRLRRTVETALQSQFGRSPGGTAPSDQLAHLAFPLTVGEQGPFGAAGVPAVLIQVSGEVGPHPNDALASAERLQEFGRGVLQAVNALDTGPEVGAPTRDILIGSRVLPASGIRLLSGVLILPGLFAAVDLVARLRRRREPVAAWFGWLAGAALPFGLAAAFAVLLGRTGLLSAAPVGPVTPTQLPLGAAGEIALVSVAIVFGLAWVSRPALTRRLPLATAPAAGGWDGCAAALTVTACVVIILTWLANPYTALLFVLPLHLWLLATALDPPPPRALGLGLVGIALIPVLGLIALYCARLGLGPSGFAWSGLLLVAGGHIGLGALVLWSLAGGCLVAAVTIVLRRARGREDAQPQITVRGPISYAGPGSLGGTDSALRR